MFLIQFTYQIIFYQKKIQLTLQRNKKEMKSWNQKHKQKQALADILQLYCPIHENIVRIFQHETNRIINKNFTKQINLKSSRVCKPSQISEAFGKNSFEKNAIYVSQESYFQRILLIIKKIHDYWNKSECPQAQLNQKYKEKYTFYQNESSKKLIKQTVNFAQQINRQNTKNTNQRNSCANIKTRKHYRLLSSTQIPFKIQIENRKVKQQSKYQICNVFYGRHVKEQKAKALFREFYLILQQIVNSVQFNNFKIKFAKQKTNHEQQNFQSTFSSTPMSSMIGTNIFHRKNVSESEKRGAFLQNSSTVTPIQRDDLIQYANLISNEEQIPSKLFLQIKSNYKKSSKDQFKERIKLYAVLASYQEIYKIINNAVSDYLNIQLRRNIMDTQLFLFSQLLDEIKRAKQPFISKVKQFNQYNKLFNCNQSHFASVKLQTYLKPKDLQKGKCKVKKDCESKVFLHGSNDIKRIDNKEERYFALQFSTGGGQQQKNRKMSIEKSRLTRPSSTNYCSRNTSFYTGCNKKRVIISDEFHNRNDDQQNYTQTLKGSKDKQKRCLKSAKNTNKTKMKQVRLLSAKFRPPQSINNNQNFNLMRRQSSRKKTMRKTMKKNVQTQNFMPSQENIVKFDQFVNKVIQSIGVSDKTKSLKPQSRHSLSVRDILERQEENLLQRIQSGQFKNNKAKLNNANRLYKNGVRSSKSGKSNTILLINLRDRSQVSNNKATSIKSFQSSQNNPFENGAMQSFNPLQIVKMRRNSKKKSTFFSERRSLSKQSRQLIEIGKKVRRQSRVRFTKVIVKQQKESANSIFERQLKQETMIQQENDDDEFQNERKNSVITQSYKCKRRNAVKKKSTFFHQKQNQFKKDCIQRIQKDLEQIQKQRQLQGLRCLWKNQNSRTTVQRSIISEQKIKKKKFTSPLRRHHFDSKDLCSLQQIEFDQKQYEKRNLPNHTDQMETNCHSSNKFSLGSIMQANPYEYLRKFRQQFKYTGNISYQALPTFFLRQELQQHFNKQNAQFYLKNQQQREKKLEQLEKKGKSRQYESKTIEFQTQQTYYRLAYDKQNDRLNYFAFDEQWISQKRGKQLYSSNNLQQLGLIDIKKNGSIIQI